MSENRIETIQNPQTEQLSSPLTIDYPLRKIDEIARDQAYLMEAIDSLSKNEDGQAVCKIVMARETTNQKLTPSTKRCMMIFLGKHPEKTAERW